MFLVHISEKFYLKIDHVNKKILSLRHEYGLTVIINLKKYIIWH